MQARPGPAPCHASGMPRSWTMPDRTGPAPAQKIRRPLRAKMPVSLTGPRAFSFSFQSTPVQEKAALRRACRSLSTEAAPAHRITIRAILLIQLRMTIPAIRLIQRRMTIPAIRLIQRRMTILAIRLIQCPMTIPAIRLIQRPMTIPAIMLGQRL